jgi:menaquinone-dependent protoporphyrinogen oxidase
MTTLIVYASSGGNTRAVSEYIASKTGGKAVNVKDVGKEDLSAYDTVIVGSRIHAGSPAKEIVSFVDSNKEALNGKKTALFLCCMFDEDKGVKQCENVSRNLGFAVSTFFVKGKKVKSGETAEVDAFIEKIA